MVFLKQRRLGSNVDGVGQQCTFVSLLSLYEEILPFDLSLQKELIELVQAISVTTQESENSVMARI